LRARRAGFRFGSARGSSLFRLITSAEADMSPKRRRPGTHGLNERIGRPLSPSADSRDGWALRRVEGAPGPRDAVAACRPIATAVPSSPGRPPRARPVSRRSDAPGTRQKRTDHVTARTPEKRSLVRVADGRGRPKAAIGAGGRGPAALVARYAAQPSLSWLTRPASQSSAITTTLRGTLPRSITPRSKRRWVIAAPSGPARWWACSVQSTS
jgi:hypothetical protein